MLETEIREQCKVQAGHGSAALAASMEGKEVKDPRGQGPTEIIQVDIKVTKTDDKRRHGRQAVNQELKFFWNEGG